MDQVLNPWMTRVGQTVDSSTQTYSDVEANAFTGFHAKKAM